MKQRFLIRLDDACPTMDRDKWARFEALLDEFEVKPIVAVIPNNEDQTLMPGQYDPHFWQKVQRWQQKEWEIALHGYNHVYTTKKIGMVPKNNFSEFAGLDLAVQSEKIKKGIAVFKAHNIQTRTWVAPGHSFDQKTLVALKKHSNISIISDGFALNPYLKNEFLWIPNQISECQQVNFSGIWTFCYHPNETSTQEINQLEAFFKAHHNAFISVDDLIHLDRKRNIEDYLYFGFKAIKNYLKIILSREN